MMNLKTNILIVTLLGIGLTFSSCSEDDDVVLPITSGTSVEVRNTFESELFSTFPGFEIYVNEAPFGDTLTSTVGSSIEFEKYLGLYDIDISNTTIDYTLVDVAPENIQFRTIEDGTFDRYYIKFSSAQAFKSATTDDEFVTATILSSTEIKVEISAGYDFTGGHEFSITLGN